MEIMTQASSEKSPGYPADDAMNGLFCKPNEAIDDMEQGEFKYLRKHGKR